MRDKFKKYNKKLLGYYLGILIILIFFNITVDPFSIFNSPKIKHYNYLKPYADRNQRITKMIDLKLHKEPIDAVFFGSSRVNTSIDVEYYKKVTGKVAKNLGMNALSHDETFKVVKNTLLVHPEIETIYIGLDFFRFLEKNKDDKRDVAITENKDLTFTEFAPVLLSFNSIISSVNTVIKNIKPQKDFDKVGLFKHKIKQYLENYKDAKLSVAEIEKLSKLKKSLNENGYKVIFYTNPIHVLDMSLINKLGYIPVYDEWKVELTKSFDFLDFAFINAVTSEPVNQDTKLFHESSHATYLMGNIIIDNLILHNNEYGVLLNNKNVEKMNKQNKQNLINWEKQNNYWTKYIDEVINNGV